MRCGPATAINENPRHLPVEPESPPGCSGRTAAGPAAMFRRQSGSSRRQIHARRRFTAVLRQACLRTTVIEFDHKLRSAH
jgi:hypothetical protein